ncbi:hypothetical protein ACFYMW_25290 [Streptomyces sp. NPDC006692]|uniref:hypothetical protein n=1 Tax=unclassified Streptomyces TaxID=2593676 RepID=UPI00343A7D40
MSVAAIFQLAFSLIYLALIASTALSKRSFNPWMLAASAATAVAALLAALSGNTALAVMYIGMTSTWYILSLAGKSAVRRSGRRTSPGSRATRVDWSKKDRGPHSAE